MPLTAEEIKKINEMSKAESQTEILSEMIKPAATSARTTLEPTTLKDGSEGYIKHEDSCPELMLKDLRLGNLTEQEIVIASEGSGIMHLLRYITHNSDLDLSEAYAYFYNDVLAQFHISNSRDGYLGKLLRTQKIDAKQEQTITDIQQQQPPQKNGILGFRR